MSKTKKYVGIVRVSSREQEEEGFSLDVQESSLHKYAGQAGGVMAKIFRIAETASSPKGRREFREAIDYVKRNSSEFDGLLFHKIDRAARNLKDFVELEAIESEHHLPFIAVSQPVENTPAGRMMRRTLANFATYTTDQQSTDVKEGIARRVAEGWFPSNPPFGYKTVRRHKRSVVLTHKQNSSTVRRIFDLRANLELTVEQVISQIFQEGRVYSASKPKFSTTKLNNILHDKSYLGFVKYKGEWHPGRHEPLIDLATWNSVRASFGDQRYKSHGLAYASGLVTCDYCGKTITGEVVPKTNKTGKKKYVYYRCSRYTKGDHPRIRLTEHDLESQILEKIKQLPNPDQSGAELIKEIAKAKCESLVGDLPQRLNEISRQLTRLKGQQDELLNVRLSGDVEDSTFKDKTAEFNERKSLLRRQKARLLKFETDMDRVIEESGELFQVIKSDFFSMSIYSRQSLLSVLFGGFHLADRTLETRNRTPIELFRTS